jgi:phosphoglycerol transferase
MRVAILNSWPNIPECAEAEWIRRALIACARLGFDAREVITSDDIMAFEPDCVLSTHEYSAKLTPFPTLGLMWSPLSFFAEDPVRRRTVLSYDGHLCGSPEIARWISDFSAGHSKEPLIHEGMMLPSTQDCGAAQPLPASPAVMYAGFHWDGSRHGAVFRGLDGRVPLKLFGPPSAWADRGAAYGGSLPFDGISVVAAIRRSGIALCLHKAAHRASACPSMRLFEAAAAGALIITDDFSFPRQWFRNSVLYVDAALPTPLMVEQIVRHVDWALANPVAASRLAMRSNSLFRRSLSLDCMLSGLPAFTERVRERRGMTKPRRPAVDVPVVEFILRTHGRSITFLERALATLKAQTHPRIGVILVQSGAVDGLEPVIATYRDSFAGFRHLVVADSGTPSSTLHAGLGAVTAPYFGLLDDDDTLFPNHVTSVLRLLDENPGLGIVLSGVVRIEDEPGTYFMPYQFNGPAGRRIPENRDLAWLEEEAFDGASPHDAAIASNAWICRSSLISSGDLIDPGLKRYEICYLFARLAGRARLGFTGMPTAASHWRSTTRDNSSFSTDDVDVEAVAHRWFERSRGLRLPATNRVTVPAPRYDASKEVYGDST